MARFTLLPLVAAFALAACGSGTAPAPENEPDPQLPDLARVVCGPNGTRIETPAVKPRRDGLHIEVVNETGADRAFSLETADGGGMGTGAPPGTSTQIVDLGPGRLSVACTDPAVEPDGGERLEVVDEDGVWVSDRLDCPEQFSSVADYAPGARGETSDPLEAAHKAVEGYGLEPNDVFEPAGYPDAEAVRVRLVRGGEPLAVVTLMDDGTGKWLVSTVDGCSSLED